MTHATHVQFEKNNDCIQTCKVPEFFFSFSDFEKVPHTCFCACVTTWFFLLNNMAKIHVVWMKQTRPHLVSTPPLYDFFFFDHQAHSFGIFFLCPSLSLSLSHSFNVYVMHTRSVSHCVLFFFSGRPRGFFPSLHCKKKIKWMNPEY